LVIYYYDIKNFRFRKHKREFFVVARAREGWGKGNIFFGGAFRKAKYEIRRRRKSEGGQKFLPPTPFLFARPSENYQNSVSGFSRKKVRILFRTDSQFVKFAFPASLGASPLASASEFSSNFQTSQFFLSPEGRTRSGNFSAQKRLQI